MTATGRPRGTPTPPWSVDLLADLHAGVLDETEAAALWPQVKADPDAMAVIAALDATTADLSAFAHEPVAPMPPEVAARIDAALAGELSRPRHPAVTDEQRPAAPLAPVVDMAAARRKRNRQLGWGGGLLTAAAAAVVAIAIAVPNPSTPGTPMAENGKTSAPPGSAPGGQPLSLRGDDVAAGLGDTLNVRDYGPLEDRAGLDECLAANDIDVDVQPAGVRPATIDGKSAVLVVLTTGKFAQYRLVALPADCGPDNPGTLYDEIIGRR